MSSLLCCRKNLTRVAKGIFSSLSKQLGEFRLTQTIYLCSFVASTSRMRNKSVNVIHSPHFMLCFMLLNYKKYIFTDMEENINTVIKVLQSILLLSCFGILALSHHFERHPVLPAAWSWRFLVEVSGSRCHSGQVFLISPAGKMAERWKEPHNQ